MKILFTVEFYQPHKGGAEEVVKQLAERLVLAGHSVTVATAYLSNRHQSLINGVAIEQFKISGNTVTGITGRDGEIERYKTFLQSGFDAVINYAAQIWTTDLAFEVLDKLKSKKIFVPCGYSGLRHPLYKNYFARLPGILIKYDKLVYPAPNYQDRQFGKEHGLEDKAVVIPNGASAEEFLENSNQNIKSSLGLGKKHLLLCVASHYRDKGHGFVIDAFVKMNREDAVLVIVGQNPGSDLFRKIKQFLFGCYGKCWLKALRHKNIILLGGQNRAVVVSAYKAADIFLFGSLVECAPLVLYESFASKTLFVSTSVGNVPDYQNFVKLASNREEMARAANFYLDHEADRKALTEQAFGLWREKYTWNKIAKQYEQLLKPDQK